jgi:ubiquinone/menaquinone biosynthesis C-methylase UbiE
MALATIDEIQQAYEGDRVAADYVEQRFASELHRLLHERQVEAVQRVIDQIRPARTLEIAPGPGRITRAIRPHRRLVCVEFNEGMIAQGRAACRGRATWLRGDGFRLPLAAGGIDLVYSFRFARHFHGCDRRRLWHEVRRVLRRGGYLVFDAVNERFSRPLREANPQDYPIYDKLYDRSTLCQEMARAGLPVVSLEPVQRYFRWQYRSQVLIGPRANWLNNLFIRGLERLPRSEGLEWIVTCRRA